jgi:hypothetical protein
MENSDPKRDVVYREQQQMLKMDPKEFLALWAK